MQVEELTFLEAADAPALRKGGAQNNVMAMNGLIVVVSDI